MCESSGPAPRHSKLSMNDQEKPTQHGAPRRGVALRSISLRTLTPIHSAPGARLSPPKATPGSGRKMDPNPCSWS